MPSSGTSFLFKDTQEKNDKSKNLKVGQKKYLPQPKFPHRSLPRLPRSTCLLSVPLSRETLLVIPQEVLSELTRKWVFWRGELGRPGGALSHWAGLSATLVTEEAQQLTFHSRRWWCSCEPQSSSSQISPLLVNRRF